MNLNYKVNQETPLNFAILVQRNCPFNLINQEASLKKANKHGETPLHMAAKVGNLDIVKALVNMEPSLMMMLYKQGMTALTLAKMHQHKDVYDFLQQAW